jgi:AbrB family looped-hinge helix DNA binding protein
MYTATVSAKGWVVIPKPLREKHGLQQGAMVRVIECGRLLALVPLPDDPVEALYGMLHSGRSLTAESVCWTALPCWPCWEASRAVIR